MSFAILIDAIKPNLSFYIPFFIRGYFNIFLLTFFASIEVPFMSNAIFAAFGTEPKSPYEETPMNIFASCIVCGLMFEIAFFFGHYLEHVLPTAYRKYHLLHHTTKADTAISGYYMTGWYSPVYLW